ncbi:MAG: hypothetical protein IJO21_02475 [Oscillospiraceae bacterium]|nr:hypothetical protein [Oscillospiraceae bacterium]
METIPETIIETISDVIPETIPETIPQVIEIVETADYTAILNQIFGSVQNVEYALQLICGFALFAVVVCLCYFCYKFFRIFF